MSPTLFRKKPVTIQAAQFLGTKESLDEISKWMAEQGHAGIGAMEGESHILKIETLEGTMTASPGDWIIRGVHGEFYPCKPEIFMASYEVA